MRNWAAMILIVIVTGGCLDDYPPAPASPFEDSAMAFVESLVVPETGLVASRSGECFTTVYKNALAAMAFLHQGNHAAATRIFDHFDNYLANLEVPFRGFPQDWDPCTGQPLNNNRWEGDNAFLLLALNYWRITSSPSDRYDNLILELVAWLSFRSQFCDTIVAEGTANMYAALLPHAANADAAAALERLNACYTNQVVYYFVLDHTVRSALVFDRYSGFDYLANFPVTENWVVTGEPISIYKAFSTDTFANIEISAQLLLAATLSNREHLVPGLQNELDKLWLYTDSGKQAGQPYFLTNTAFAESAELGIIDPTVYMLFVYWRFNPFRPTTSPN